MAQSIEERAAAACKKLNLPENGMAYTVFKRALEAQVEESLKEALDSLEEMADALSWDNAGDPEEAVYDRAVAVLREHGRR